MLCSHLIILIDVLEVVQLVDVRGAIFRLLVHILLCVLKPADKIVDAVSNVVDGGGFHHRRFL